MFKVASLNGNGANQTLLSMNNLVEGNIHGGIIDNTTGTKQNVTFIVGTVEFPLSVDANGTTPVSKINVPSDTTVQVNAPIGVNVSISYIETVADASAALTTIQGLVSEADTSATNAGISATNANNSAINANNSEIMANNSEIMANNSEIMANKWAVNPEDTEVLTGQFSAYHWARKAQAVASGDVIDDNEINDLLTWSSTKINSLDVANVKLSGDQTIEDVKTFTSSPIVPTPTASNDAVNKKYVDKADYLQPTLTANATLTGIDNKIVMNGIVTTLGLEIGDVIQFTSVANTNNQKMRTVESIINDNEIIVNYEHCGNRGNGTLKLTDETLTNATITRISKWYNAPIGLGQEWVNVKNNRLIDTTYNANNNRAMVAACNTPTIISAEADKFAFNVNGVIIPEMSTGNPAASTWRRSVYADIPPNATYKLEKIGAGTSIENWKELR